MLLVLLRLHDRDGGIRTRDPLNPIQVRYRTALRPGNLTSYELRGVAGSRDPPDPSRSEAPARTAAHAFTRVTPTPFALPDCATSRKLLLPRSGAKPNPAPRPLQPTG